MKIKATLEEVGNGRHVDIWQDDDGIVFSIYQDEDETEGEITLDSKELVEALKMLKVVT